MTLDLNQSNVSLDNQVFIPMLTNLQANVLKFHGRKFAHHLFVVFDKTKISDAVTWIKNFASNEIISAKKQLEDTENFKLTKTDGGSIYTLSLSNSGFEKLNRIPDIKNSAALKNGLRGSAGRLNDKPETWEAEFQNQIDALILVADDDATTAFNNANNIIQQISSFGKCVKDQRGNVLKMKDTGVGIEHFSYADGISQPMYLKDEIDGQKAKHYQAWDDTTTLDKLLVQEQDSKEPDCFGSYLVFRKLEQHVAKFKDAEGDNGPTPGTRLIKVNGKVVNMKDETGADNDELAGAMIVGRYENSTPVAKTSLATNPNPTPAIVDNDFSYQGDLGLKCPYHAHIRLMNPRKGDPKEKTEDLLKHRITRRGITFDDHTTPFDASLNVDDRKRFDENKITEIEDPQLHINNQPKDKVGLLFMCYQSNITDQFEVLQADFANQGLIGSPDVKGQDSLITQGTDLPRWLPQQWGQPLRSDPFQFSGFITMKGGEYFYTPSISFLKNL